jgi:hypothetical protein
MVAAPVHANLVHMSFTSFDFRMTLSSLSTPHDQPPRRRVRAGRGTRAVAQVVPPAAAIESVIDLLRTELTEFSERFGAPTAVLQPPT